ncbi:MAG: pterin-4-alpha-carbinolamine dehydratase [Flavipsychrobacter sp.]|jgi:4a-hydroxytetrahydrobiopterin dehydratase|nr:pterin-4-alpha-carbinolamine dehydratase [Flavipsychrobacter sp.]
MIMVLPFSNFQILKFSNYMAWEEKDNSLYRSFKFNDFSEAFAFMTRVAILAEKQNHHPTWKNTWNTVEIWLNTHDAGNTVTDRDRKLAASIDKLTGTPNP